MMTPEKSDPSGLVREDDDEVEGIKKEEVKGWWIGLLVKVLAG